MGLRGALTTANDGMPLYILDLIIWWSSERLLPARNRRVVLSAGFALLLSYNDSFLPERHFYDCDLVACWGFDLVGHCLDGRWRGKM